MAVAECGASVSQSIVLIAVDKQQQPCLRGTGLHICQAFCIYRPLEKSLSGSVDQASVLLVMPTFSKLCSVCWGLDRRFLRGRRLIAPESQVLSVGGFDHKIGIQFRLDEANGMLCS